MTTYSPSWPHSDIKQIFPNVFMVTGTNITQFAGSDLQHSRNMIIVRQNGELSLINTVRLTPQGLNALEALGKITNVIRIGAFHGRDDAFYLDRYKATLWALPGMVHENNKTTDIELTEQGQMPFAKCSLFVFETSVHKEGCLLLDQEGGILITCDSIKNWVDADEFFSDESAKLYASQGFFGQATISTVWLDACQVKQTDFERLLKLKFHHLLSAHGEPLLNQAQEKLKETISTIKNW
ncbi:MAG: hypothetical protein JSR17_06485 [Proteobacteria bacterium]|nr:hypothetical protein [Pseudomonadota bacterium]